MSYGPIISECGNQDAEVCRRWKLVVLRLSTVHDHDTKMFEGFRLIRVKKVP